MSGRCRKPPHPLLLFLDEANVLSIQKSSYYDKDYRQAAALIRARRPYLVKNIITGAALFSFTIAVCTILSSHTQVSMIQWLALLTRHPAD